MRVADALPLSEIAGCIDMGWIRGIREIAGACDIGCEFLGKPWEGSKDLLIHYRGSRPSGYPGAMTRTAPWLAIALLAASASPAPTRADTAGSDDAIRFVASNLFQTANGRFHRWRVAEARIDPSDLAGSFVEVEVDLASVDTGIEARDDHLRTEDFFEVATWPTASVRVHAVEPAGRDDAGRERYRAHFDLDLHGVQKTLPGEFSVASRDPFVVEGSLVVDRLDFGIGTPRSFWNPMSITEEIPVTFRAAIPNRTP